MGANLAGLEMSVGNNSDVSPSVEQIKGLNGEGNVDRQLAPLPRTVWKRKDGQSVASAKACWQSLTQWLCGYSTFPIRNPGF
jgi:hypothetical protein